MKITFITGNKEKVRVAKEAMKGLNIELDAFKIDCPEIQADDTEDIAKVYAKMAFEKLKCAVIKVDSGLFIEELNGFPGPYSEYVERKLDANDILKLMKGIKNRKAYYKDVLAYCDNYGNITTFTSFTKGKISSRMSGKKGYNFDRIFIKENDTKTMANYSDKTRAKKYNNDYWKNLIKFLNSK